MRFLYIIDSTKITLVAMRVGVASRQGEEDRRRANAYFGRQEPPEEEKARLNWVSGNHGRCGFGARNHRGKVPTRVGAENAGQALSKVQSYRDYTQYQAARLSAYQSTQRGQSLG
jgi:hypothetical protein